MGEDRGILGSIFQYFGNYNYIYIYIISNIFFFSVERNDKEISEILKIVFLYEGWEELFLARSTHASLFSAFPFFFTGDA